MTVVDVRTSESAPTTVAETIAAGDTKARSAPRPGPSPESSGRIRAAVVEPHTFQRDGTAAVLVDSGRVEVAFAGVDLPEFLSWWERELPGNPLVLVVGLLPLRNEDQVVDVISALRSEGVRVVLLSSVQHPAALRRAISAGIDGIVSKYDTVEVFLDTFFAVSEGRRSISGEVSTAVADLRRPKLQAQEQRLLELYIEGHTIREASALIGVREQTGRMYLSRARSRYRAVGSKISSRLDLAMASHFGIDGGRVGSGALFSGDDRSDDETSSEHTTELPSGIDRTISDVEALRL